MSILSPYPEPPKESGMIDWAKRIIGIRQNDLAIFNGFFLTEGYTKGLARQTVDISASTDLARTTLFADVDTSSGNVTVTLDAAPLDGQSHIIVRATSGNTLTIDGNGTNINGSATISITNQYDAKFLIFMGGANEWRSINVT